MSNFRLYLLTKLIQLYWWCEWVLENLPHPKQHKPIFFDPLSATAITILVGLATSAASLGAQLLVTKLLTPKPKPQIKGKLTGDITLNDTIWGAPVIDVFGAAPGNGDNIGGMEVGCNIIWASEIRKIQTQVPGGGGGHSGGKGGRSNTPPTIQISYKYDVAAAVGNGPLKLLRLKFNEDVVFGGAPSGGGGNPVPTRFEAEAPENELSGGAVVASDDDCSGNQKVTGIGLGGKLIFTFDASRSPEVPIEPVDPPPTDPIPHYFIEIRYKSVGDSLCYVKLNGTGGIFTFPDTAGAVGVKFITRRVADSLSTLEFSNPDAAGPEIDCVDFTTEFIYEPSVSPTGIRDDNFPPEKPQNNLLLPDPNDVDTNAAERFNAPVPEAIDGVMEVTLVNGASLAWYEGTEDQPIDAVIAAALGADSTPAFRGTAYGRIKDLDFSKWGAPPTMRWLVYNPETKTVAEICTKLAKRVGLEDADLDFSAVSDLNVRGYFINGIEAPTKTFDELELIFNLSFAETDSGQIKAINLSDRTSVATVRRADLGAYDGESDEPPANDVESILIDESTDLIKTFELQFYNPSTTVDFGTDRAEYTFPYTSSNRKETKSVNALLTKDEARLIPRREIQKNHLKTSPNGFSIPYKFAGLEPGQCFELEIENNLQLVRLEEKTGSAPGIFECSASNEKIFYLADEEDTSATKIKAQPVVSFPSNTVGTIMDLPPVQDTQKEQIGVYIAACPKDINSGRWESCVVYRAKGVDYQQVKLLTKAALIGRVVSLLEDAPTDLARGVEDTENSVTVDFYGSQSPTTVTDDQAQDGANAFVVGSEVVVIRTWTRDNDYPNRWVGTNILRKLKNSGKFAGEHEIGERVVFLSDAVAFIPLDVDELGIERSWKFVTSGNQIEDAAPISFAWTGENLTQGRFVSELESRLLTAADAGKTINNSGALDLLELQLPAPASELIFNFAVTDPAGIRIKAESGGKIHFGAYESAENGYAESLIPCSFLTVCAIDGKWMVRSSSGTWTLSE